MDRLSEQQLLEVLSNCGEPLLIVRLDKPDWPVVFSNAAFDELCTDDHKFFGDVLDRFVGRERALEISDALRARREASFAVDIGGREYLLALKWPGDMRPDGERFCAVYFRSGAALDSIPRSMTQHALLKARSTVKDLERVDPVTGLLNEHALRDLFQHDWAVAQREKSTLAVVVFTVEDFGAYEHTFGRHATEACLRKVGQAIRRCLRRASDVVARVDGDRFVALSHASEADGVVQFAERIAGNVRELGLHHPKSTTGKFVTVRFAVEVATPSDDDRSPDGLLDELFDGAAERARLADAAGG